MRKNTVLILLMFVSLVGFAQINGVVKDSITGQPIPYVNIAIANENKGTTSEENGAFVIHENDKNKRLIFSALGFEKKSIAISKAATVYLKPSAVALDEVVIVKRYGTKEIEIGKCEHDFFQAFDNGSRIDARFFEYQPQYKKTKFIKQVVVRTDSKIDNASFKIHIYGVDANGFPSNELLSRDMIVSVNHGVKQTKFNMLSFNLKMPKNGIFVGIEKLIIEKNKLEKTSVDANTNTLQTQKTYYPLLLYNAIEMDFLFSYSGGKWNKQIKQNQEGILRSTNTYVPAINLILTN